MHALGDVVTDIQRQVCKKKAALWPHCSYNETELDCWNMFMPFDLIQYIILSTNLQAKMAQYPLIFEKCHICLACR